MTFSASSTGMRISGLIGLWLLSAGFDFARRDDACQRDEPIEKFSEVARFDVPAANQGIGVDERHFYAIDNALITKHDKRSGAEVGRYEWKGDPLKNPLLHLDSAVAVNGKLFCAHSNYPEWPMTSSVEVWDTRTMKHVASHSFGIRWGSLTWLDWHDGHWWATFANYNRTQPHPDPDNPNAYDVLPGQEDQRLYVDAPYGYKRNTVVVKFSFDFRELESWVLPDEILTPERTGNMSNSGGSWGPDGYLYLTGHDNAEVYKVKLPEIGSKLELVSIIPLRNGDGESVSAVSIRGQGIAWDRSTCNELYGIIRATGDEESAGVSNKVTVSRIAR